MPTPRRIPTPTRPAGLVDRPHPLLDEAERLWKQAEFERALFTYDRALAADPLNARIIINAARAYMRRNRPSRASELLDSLARAKPDDPRVHHMIGESLRLASLPARAIQSFETARRLGDAGAKAALELGALQEQAGRLDAAMHLVESVASTDPHAGWALLLKAQILRRTRRFDEALRTVETLIAGADPQSDTGAQAWAERALIHDAAGDASAAIHAIEKCKAIQRTGEPPAWRAAQHVAARFGGMIRDLDRARADAWSARMADASPATVPPVALLAGFPRSGTTLLEQVLDAHPAITSIEERDILAGETFPSLVHGHAIDAPIIPILDALPRKQLGRVRDRYIAALRDWHAATELGKSAGALLLDKNPGATLLIPMLRALIPRAPVIVALRDPRDVVLSCYLRHLPVNPVSANFLTIERTAAKYALDMGAWLRFRELYPHDTQGWIEVKYEDLVDDLPSVARRVLATLGQPWDEQVLGYRERADARIVTSPTYDKVREPVTRKAVGRWRAYEQLLAPALPTLEPFVRAFGYE